MPRLSGKQTVVTFSILFMCAKRSLKAAQTNEEGSFYELLNCLVMSAFTVEAYMNHLGALHFRETFNKFEKKSIWDKYKALREVCLLPQAGFLDAYPSVANLLEFRNAMAHGRTEDHVIDKEIADLTIPESIRSNVVGWRQYVTLGVAEEAVKNVELLITELHKASGSGNHPFLNPIYGRYGLSSKDQAT